MTGDPQVNTVKPERADQDRVRDIVADAARRYFEVRHQMVASFCARHFSLKGAWRLNRKAWGHDLWRAPVNVLWAMPYVLSRSAAGVSRRLGWTQLAEGLGRIPPGFKTAVAAEVEWLIYTELLELPLTQPDRNSPRDALLEAILSHEGIAELLLPDLLVLSHAGETETTRSRLESYFLTYTGSRNAAADLAGSLMNLAGGALAFQQFTPGSIALGGAAATALAQQLAVANFALGPTLGSVYYSLFPAAASAGLVAGAIGGTMLALGILTAFTGIVTDPVQQALGVHERRLHRLLDALQNTLFDDEDDFRLRDAYVARIFDLLDIVKTAVQLSRH
jgi:hypothetical protein